MSEPRRLYVAETRDAEGETRWFAAIAEDAYVEVDRRPTAADYADIARIVTPRRDPVRAVTHVQVVMHRRALGWDGRTIIGLDVLDATAPAPPDPHFLSYRQNAGAWRSVCACGWESPAWYATKQGAAWSHRGHRGGAAGRCARAAAQARSAAEGPA